MLEANMEGGTQYPHETKVGYIMYSWASLVLRPLCVCCLQYGIIYLESNLLYIATSGVMQNNYVYVMHHLLSKLFCTASDKRTKAWGRGYSWA